MIVKLIGFYGFFSKKVSVGYAYIVDVYFRIYNFANGNRIREITKCKNSL